MTLPANIRVNTLLPFPALVTGSGPISVTKVNGIWTINYAIENIPPGNPVGVQLNNDYLLVWDSVAQTFFTVPMSFFGTAGTTQKQRSITSGPVIIGPSDQILNLNLSSSLTITLPAYASRNGQPLTFKDVGNQATAFPQTITAAGGETIDGFTTIPFDVNGESITLSPANDGLNTGWYVI